MYYYLTILLSFCCVITNGVDAQVSESVAIIPKTKREISLTFAPIVKQVAPTVVNIYATNVVEVKLPFSPFLDDPFFKQFFKKIHGQEKFAREQNALGSGVIIDPQGLVLTNYHVIKNAEIIRVALSNKNEFAAKVIATDKQTDLALLQLEAAEKKFPYLKIEEFDNVEVGDLVLAIGNPFGVGQTVTSGIVSALARSQEGISDFRSFIQTDAAINPGNSGGPLITVEGKMIGINTAIFSKTGGSMGISFAIPINMAIPLLHARQNGGKVIRPWSGLQVIPITSEIAQNLGLPHPYGVVVTKVHPLGAGKKAHIIPNDVILKVNGKEVENDGAFSYQIAVLPVHSKAIFTILRKKQEIEVPIILDAPYESTDKTSFDVMTDSPLKGLTVCNMSPAVAIENNLDPYLEGLLIRDVHENTPAGTIGLRPGDILLSINKHFLKDKNELKQVLRQHFIEWNIEVQRGKNTFQLHIKL